MSFGRYNYSAAAAATTSATATAGPIRWIFKFISCILGLKIISLLQTLINYSLKPSKHESNPFMRLTDDLLLEIMYRVPVKSIGRCKAVCKPWRSLISDPDFVVSHLKFSEKNGVPLTLVSQRRNIVSTLELNDHADITEGVTIVPVDQQFVDDDYDGYCFIVGSCDGLVCLYLKEMDRRYSDSLYLWNPVTDEDLEVSLPVRWNSSYLCKDSSWFGAVPSSDDYKIFLVFKVNWVDICMYLYSFRYCRWEEIIVSYEDADSIKSSKSVFMNEALHYLVLNEWIFKFDLVEGSFEKIPYSIEPALLPDYQQISLGAIGKYDCLCAMFMRSSEEWSMFELWKLEEYDNWDSWAKLYRIDLPLYAVYNCRDFLDFTYSGELCIQTEDGVILVDPSSDPPSYVNVRDKKVYEVMDYVESLVSLESFP